ncbi:MAG TPA: AcvB/VirJ family lysyl-phosphatidylglycerol hydrolase [Dyella sp.]|uniref:AcvB/VirJ family lysyl-phosphatidylglycerol hydrolase n=1 Tax=Dyella sp. TaxID=1869338 RepID=UPI002D791419|nr:AcvB/VirJ family lysyl-phosphatidylglycerol hydrolase [Dyella sp.]HET6554124.1 AcvB/VirJ family lysyl-phosphatidylglycerol hydrolase [Dyella sp.]
MLVVLVVAGVGVWVWQPWHHVTLDEAIVSVPAKAGVVPMAGREDVVAVFYSGDGGWRDLDQSLGKIIASHGIPVEGVSLLQYYWREKSAAESAADLDALIARLVASGEKKRIWLIGFSFGADVLPSVVGQLSPEGRARIAQIVMLSPSMDVNFEIEMEGYMREGWWKTHTQDFFQWLNPVRHYDAHAPLLALEGHPPVVCYYGLEDKDDTICAEPGLPAWIKVYEKKGDHHFDYNYEGLARQMIEDLPAHP